MRACASKVKSVKSVKAVKAGESVSGVKSAMTAPRRWRAVAGMTLVELMVGMAVGLFVATVAIATFVSTRTLNVVNASTTRMGENARLAMDTLHTELRNSGFAGCWPLALRKQAWPDVLNASASDDFIVDGRLGLRGYKGDPSGNFSPAPNAALLQTMGLGRTLQTNSDIISVRVPADEAAWDVTEAMATADANPKLHSGAFSGLGAPEADDILLIADCTQATLFRVTSVDPATGLLGHGVQTGALRNKQAGLGHTYGKGATVYRVQTRHYFVARSADNINSLWRLSVPARPGEAAAVEVAKGIDRLLVRYGINTVADQDVTRYVDAAAVPAWDRVVSARVQLLPATPSDNMATARQTYRFDGQDVTATDRRVRNPLTEVVTLRTAAK